ncbi:MAG: hypothetical protein AB7F35_19850 [Acetobacteraceae bacterium]
MAEQQEEAGVIPARKAQQAETILRRRWQRVVFLAGLVGAVVLALVLGVIAY